MPASVPTIATRFLCRCHGHPGLGCAPLVALGCALEMASVLGALWCVHLPPRGVWVFRSGPHRCTCGDSKCLPVCGRAPASLGEVPGGEWWVLTLRNCQVAQQVWLSG